MSQSSPRPAGRADDELRSLSFTRDFTEMAAGSCLVTFGRTRVLCTASVSEYNELISVFRSGQPNIIDPFDGREVKVAIKSVEYSASNGDLKMQIIEDVD